MASNTSGNNGNNGGGNQGVPGNGHQGGHQGGQQGGRQGGDKGAPAATEKRESFTSKLVHDAAHKDAELRETDSHPGKGDGKVVPGGRKER